MSFDILATIFSLVISIAGVVVALPRLTQFLLYHTYRPNLELTLETVRDRLAGLDQKQFSKRTNDSLNSPISWKEFAGKDDASELYFHLLNREPRSVICVPEFHIDRPWQVKDSQRKLLAKHDLGGYYDQYCQYKPIKLDPITEYKSSTRSRPFPFTPEDEECNLRVILHMRVELYSFRLPVIGLPLPRYFGNAELKPIILDY